MMNIRSISVSEFDRETSNAVKKGKEKSELSRYLMNMKVGECAEFTFDDKQEFIKGRQIVAQEKVRTGGFLYSSSVKKKTVVVQKTKEYS